VVLLGESRSSQAGEGALRPITKCSDNNAAPVTILRKSSRLRQDGKKLELFPSHCQRIGKIPVVSDYQSSWVRQHLACLDLDPPIWRQIHSLLKVDRVCMPYLHQQHSPSFIVEKRYVSLTPANRAFPLCDHLCRGDEREHLATAVCGIEDQKGHGHNSLQRLRKQGLQQGLSRPVAIILAPNTVEAAPFCVAIAEVPKVLSAIFAASDG